MAQSPFSGSDQFLLGDGATPPQIKQSTSDPSYFPTVKKVTARQICDNIWVVASAFFRDKESRCRSWSMAALSLVMMFGFSLLHLWFVKMFGDFQNALHDKDKDKFYSTLYKIIAVAIGTMPISAFRDALKGSLALEWRRYLTSKLLAEYIGDTQAYYRLKLQGSDIDNPDQRIAQDTGQFTNAILNFTSTVLQAVITILTQSGMLLSISPELFLFVVVYSLFMNVVTFVVFGGRLTSTNRAVLAQEASFRFALVRVRENAEPIAFYRGAPFEKARCGETYSELMSTLYYKLCLTVTFSSFFSVMTLLISVLPYAVVAGKYLSGEMDFGAMSEAAVILGGLERAFNTMVGEIESLTAMGAQAVRVRQIWEALDSIAQGNQRKEGDDEALLESGGELGVRAIELVEIPDSPSNVSSRDVLLRLEDVTLQPPQGGLVPLVHDLSLELRAGESLLVSGPSGIGKSSLLRAIGGLWSSGRGSIQRCGTSQCFFVPQEPYLCLGTLRENATYPGSMPSEVAGAAGVPPPPRDSEVKAALKAVGMQYLLERYDLDEAVDLAAVLSGGERQRLGFARLLLRPAGLRFAIMDEATSALDEANENNVYQLLGSRVASYVSVGHRANLERFHTHKLSLMRTSSGDCKWALNRRGAVPSGGQENESNDQATGNELIELEELDKHIGFCDSWKPL